MRLTRTLLGLLLCLPIQAAELGSFLPAGGDYDPTVPRPDEVLGQRVGEWHVRHDQLELYLRTLAEASDRVRLEVTGRTHEGRALLLLTVSSPANLARIEELRAGHLRALAQGQRGEGPLIVWEGFSVHGNEASGANAALLLAYHLAAGRGPALESLLADTVVLIDPAINPDGLGRFAQWANSHRGLQSVADPNHREHLEVWPNGRTNHYWFDLNRDWLLLVQPESRARVEQYHRWRPHVLTDHHEMGHDSTFFFQPGVPERKHPLTPERNEELTRALAQYHARAFDAAGELYYSEETFDDYYFGKGSSYPDVNGTVGILFEQGTVRGLRIDTPHGERTFADAIRNQLRVALSTLDGAHALREELFGYQAEFQPAARRAAADDPVKAWVIGDGGDPSRAFHLLDTLWRHRIEVHPLRESVTIEGRSYEPGSAWVVPTDQAQYRLVRALFERRTEFEDSTFYDVSAWTLPLAFNLPCDALRRVPQHGQARTQPEPPRGSFAPSAYAYAYAVGWDGYYAPRALGRLLAAEARVYAAMQPFTAPTADGTSAFERGTLLVPVAGDPEHRRTVEAALAEAAREDGVAVAVLPSGLTSQGIDLGSPQMRRIEAVKPLLLVGSGVSGYEAGEVWHLLDTRVALPLTMVDLERLDGIDLRAYTHVIMVDGKYGRIDEPQVQKMRGWIEAGGVLVATKRGAEWATQQGLHLARQEDEQTETACDAAERDATDKADDEQSEPAEQRFRSYAQFPDDRSRRRISGAIVETYLDATHPVAYGYRQERLAVFRNGTVFLEPSDNPYETVARYTDEPLLSGFVGAERLAELAGSAAIVAGRVGKGAVIRFADDPNFRGIWYGTNRLFLNALFFGPLLDRTELDGER